MCFGFWVVGVAFATQVCGIIINHGVILTVSNLAWLVSCLLRTPPPTTDVHWYPPRYLWPRRIRKPSRRHRHGHSWNSRLFRFQYPGISTWELTLNDASSTTYST